jgi:dCTP deaminase
VGTVKLADLSILKWIRSNVLAKILRGRVKPMSSIPPESSSAELIGKLEVIALINQRRLLVEPILDQNAQLDQLGVDLRLDCFFREFVRSDRGSISPGDEAHGTTLREIEPFRDSFFLQPSELVLAQSFEYVALPNNMLCLLSGRSSLGRRGLVVHATANVIDPGFRGHIVFELANLGVLPIELFPLMRVARLVFMRTKQVDPYEGPYMGQIRINPPSADRLVAKLMAIRAGQSAA